MAVRIRMKHPDTGVTKEGFYGFSWTSLFFGGFPALFRGDFVSAAIVIILWAVLTVFTFGIGSFVLGIAWAFLYNKRYTLSLVEKGYQFDDIPERVAEAKAKLGIQ